MLILEIQLSFKKFTFAMEKIQRIWLFVQEMALAPIQINVIALVGSMEMNVN
jgi:hypothetical protein